MESSVKTFSEINRITVFEDVTPGPAGMELTALLYFYFYFAYDTLANVGELYYSNTSVFLTWFRGFELGTKGSINWSFEKELVSSDFCAGGRK